VVRRAFQRNILLPAVMVEDGRVSPRCGIKIGVL